MYLVCSDGQLYLWGDDTYGQCMGTSKTDDTYGQCMGTSKTDGSTCTSACAGHSVWSPPDGAAVVDVGIISVLAQY